MAISQRAEKSVVRKLLMNDQGFSCTIALSFTLMDRTCSQSERERETPVYRGRERERDTGLQRERERVIERHRSTEGERERERERERHRSTEGERE